jgi:hypothetical protein
MSYEVNINAKQINDEDKKKYGTVPDGEYVSMMTDYETKSGPKGEYLSASFQIVDGEFKNRKIFDRYFINASPAAVAIAHSKWSAIGISVGIETIKNLDQLLNKPFLMKIGTEKGEGDYPDKNVYKGAKPLKADLTARPAKIEPTPQQLNAKQTGFEDDVF